MNPKRRRPLWHVPLLWLVSISCTGLLGDSVVRTRTDGPGGGDPTPSDPGPTNGDPPGDASAPTDEASLGDPTTGCPPAIDFATRKAELDGQGLQMSFVKIGFHVGPGGNSDGLDEAWACLDAAGVPAIVKSVDDGSYIHRLAQLREQSGVPHVLIYRKSGGGVGWDAGVPEYDRTPEEAAALHWQRHRDAFEADHAYLLPYRDWIWIETVNELDKNRAEWIGEFATHTAQQAMADGYHWAAFGWSSGEPEPTDWQGPEMQAFLTLAAQHPDQIAIALHEYSYTSDNLDNQFPYLVGRYQSLFAVTDQMGIARPTVLITEFGWGAFDVAASVDQALNVDLPWAAEVYAQDPEVLGAAIWYLGPGFSDIADDAQKLIAPLTAFALQTAYGVP